MPTPNDIANETPRRVAIIGVGLLGGSVGLALRRKLPDVEIVGMARREAVRKLALQCGAVTESTDTVREACRGCDVVVIATPVDRISEIAIEAAEAAGADCLLTDVGSTKLTIVEAIAKHPNVGKQFVAAHPIAGSEKTGVENATDSLFDDKPVILTPGETVPDLMRRRAEHFWQLVGGRTAAMTPAEHDLRLATISHVPHLASAAAAKLVNADSLPFVGSGWLDVTRVAAGDPEMWTAICKENRGPIVAELARLRELLDKASRLIESGDDDGLRHWLAEAKRVREQA